MPSYISGGEAECVSEPRLYTTHTHPTHPTYPARTLHPAPCTLHAPLHTSCVDCVTQETCTLCAQLHAPCSLAHTLHTPVCTRKHLCTPCTRTRCTAPLQPLQSSSTTAQARWHLALRERFLLMGVWPATRAMSTPGLVLPVAPSLLLLRTYTLPHLPSYTPPLLKSPYYPRCVHRSRHLRTGARPCYAWC